MEQMYQLQHRSVVVMAGHIEESLFHRASSMNDGHAVVERCFINEDQV